MIVLDTHALVWWVSGDVALSTKARTVIEREQTGGTIVVSSISAWEIAMLVEHERLHLSMDAPSWIATVEAIEGLRFAPVDADTAMKSVTLPGAFHQDPADRMIVATARKLSAPLVTKDHRLRAYPQVQTIW